MGGRGRGKYKKKYSRKGKLNEKKIHARQLILKIFMLWPKKNSYKEFDDEKNFCGSKIPLLSITFLMVRPLRRYREDSFGSKTGDNEQWMDLHVRLSPRKRRHTNPKHQSFPSQSPLIFISRKRSLFVSDRDHFLC